ncbi:MAG: VCBS repeat-containing protein [Polyangiales bacterium]
MRGSVVAMSPARWIPWTLWLLACAPTELEVLDGGARDSGARTDRGSVDAPRTDAPGLDAAARLDGAASPDAAVTDAAAMDTLPADAPRADGGASDARAACTVTPSAEPFRSPVLRLHWRASAGAFRGIDQVCSTPVVADIVREAPDAERVPEVAFMTFDCTAGYPNGVLRVMSGRAPYAMRWSQNGSDRPNAEGTASTLRWDGHPAVADLDGVPGNGLEIVAVTQSSGLIAFRSDGSVYWRTQEARGTVTGANPSVNIADLDMDGVPEVIAGASVFHGRTGAVRWVGTAARGVNGQGPLSVVADLDGDGYLEVIAGRTVYENNGRVRFGGAMAEGFAAVADLLDAAGAAATACLETSWWPTACSTRWSRRGRRAGR